MRPTVSRSAVCYIGSVLFLATGMLALGDQPLNNRGPHGFPCFNCTKDGVHPFPCVSLGISSCLNGRNCTHCTCAWINQYVSCT